MDEPTELIFFDLLRRQSTSDAKVSVPVDSRLMQPGTADTEALETGELPKRHGWHGMWKPGGGTWTPPKTTDELKDLLDNLRRWNPEGD